MNRVFSCIRTTFYFGALGLAASGASFIVFGDSSLTLIGSNFTPQDISDDGKVVVGLLGNQAALWTASGGFEVINSNSSIATGVSADGTKIVGYEVNNGSFEWTRSTGLSGFGPSTSVNPRISPDGLVDAGTTKGSSFGTAFRYTSIGGVVPIQSGPGYSQPHGLSFDGNVIVGAYQPTYGTSDSKAFRWTEATGMEFLGTLPGANSHFSIANAITSDAKVIAGTADSGIGQQAFRWTASTGMIGLGHLPNAIETALGVSDNGNVIVGYAQVGGAQDYRAFLWDPANGIRYLSQQLQIEGADLAGINLTAANGVSGDGRTIIGYGSTGGWIAHLSSVPEPATYSIIFGIAAVCAVLPFRGKSGKSLPA